ncbi:MAG: DNA gyrase subunit A, partial [Alphaproteobacteria bacterium]|nr:DNA gyrase subunit A [Alphaproteobacteria bacterium]
KGRTGMATREEDFVTRLFVASTHAPLLLFSSRGLAYKTKVYQLPLGTPQARGKALVNVLPLQEGESITTVMPMPEDESRWKDLYVMFATESGHVRRNSLEDFVSVKSNGKIAMKLDEGDALVSVQICEEQDNVLLATRGGKCIRFEMDDVRVFSGRTSTGVRGINLAEGDKVISMTILKGTPSTTEERYAYLRLAAAKRRAEGVEAEPEPMAPAEEGAEPVPQVTLTEERAAELARAEQFILTIAADGFGKRTSAYEYRVTGRGGKGIDSINLGKGENSVVAAFPVSEKDQIMLVTDGGRLIRCPVHDIRIAGRTTRGVTLFRVDESERVVSVARLGDVSGGEDGNGHAPDGAGGNGADMAAEEGANGAGEAALGENGEVN